MEIKVSNIYYSIDDKDLFSNLSIENITYADIIASMNSLLEENKNNGMSRQELNYGSDIIK